jgi:hypothetical protein
MLTFRVAGKGRSGLWLLSFLCTLCLCGEGAFANPPTASYIFPAGGRRGTKVKVRVGGLYLYKSCSFELLGRGVAASKQIQSIPTPWFEGPLLPLTESQQQEDYPHDMAGEIRIGADAPLGMCAGRVWTAEGAAGGLRFVVGDLPEIIEHEIDGDPIPVETTLPVTINGRIFPREDVDDWSFAVRKGQCITAAVAAARLGSPLDSRLELFDPRGRKIAENDDFDHGNDSRLQFTAGEDGVYRLRILDANQKGGPAYVYRLTIAEGRAEELPQKAEGVGQTPDFRVHFTTDTATLPRGGQTRLRVVAERSGGFTGPIALRVAGLPVGVSASDVTIASGQTAADILLTTTAHATPGTAHLSIHGSAALVGRIVARTASLSNSSDGTTIDNVLLSVALKPPFKIVGDYDLRLAPRGSIFRRRYRIERNGFTGPLEVRLADHQTRHLQGVTGPTLIVPAHADTFEYPVQLPPWMETGRTSRACVQAVGVIREGQTEYTVGYSSDGQNEQIIAVVETGRLGVEVDRPSIAAVPGQKATLMVRVRRGKGLTGPIKLELIRPEHMHGIHAEPVILAADQSQAAFPLHFAADKLGPFNMPVVLRATLGDTALSAIAEAKVEIVPEK